MSVLIIEDDPTISKNIVSALWAEQINAVTVFDGQLAQKMLKKNYYDCIIMDINLPGINGYELTKAFRSYNTQTPILMLTAFADLEDKVEGFEQGADDYLTKPFFMKELIIRVKSLINRSKISEHGKTDQEIIVAGDLLIHLKEKMVKRNGQIIDLTPREFQILSILAASPGEVFAKNQLFEAVWGTNAIGNTNSLEVYINFLRNKIDKPFQKSSLKTKIGYGYYFEIEP